MMRKRRWPQINVFARAAIPLAALALISLTLFNPLDAGRAEADHLCSATGSPRGPFDITTWEAGDYRTVYGQTMELAGTNQLFPSLGSFAVPRLNSGPRSAPTLASPFIPPVLLKAIGSVESSWAQADYSVPYGNVGPVLASHDCGYGIMQVTSGMQNVAGVPNLDQAMIGGHYAFNIARGGRILSDKWNMAPAYRPVVGSANPKTIEDWYFALWGYNGFAFQNHPLNPAFSPQRASYSCGPLDDGFGHDRSSYPYQELVYGCAEHPAVRGGQALWTPQDVHLPDLSDPRFAGPLSVSNWTACSQYLQCAAMDIPTPNTNHQAQVQSVPSRENVIGAPVVRVSPASLNLVWIPGVREGSGTVTVSNSGTGVLAYRVKTTASWLRVTRSQGVSLGTDLGSRSSSFGVRTSTGGLLPGTYRAEIVIESLYASGAPKRIPVTISSALITGSGPQVYLASSGLKRWIPNPETFEANGFAWGEIQRVADSVLDSMPDGNPLPDVLADGNLIAGAGRPEVYVMESGKKRHITSSNAMGACGYSFTDVRRISGRRIDRLTAGPSLSRRPCPRLSPANGSLVTGSDDAIYVMSSGLKRHIPDPATFEGLGFDRGNVDRVGNTLLAWVPTGNPMPSVLADGNLITGRGRPEVYVMQAGKKRHVTSRDAMEACGYSFADMYVLSQSRAAAVPTGDAVSGPPCPRLAPLTGSLLQGSDGAIYVARYGLKRHIPDPATFEALGFKRGNVDAVSDALLAWVTDGTVIPSVLADGNLIASRGRPEVYVMHSGRKRHMTSREAMSACEYSFANIWLLPASRVDATPSGQALSGEPCPQIAYEDGRLVKSIDSSAVYVMRSGLKRHIPDPATMDVKELHFGNIDTYRDSMVSAIPTGAPLLSVLANGGVIKGTAAALYVMDGGVRRPLDASAMSQCGYGNDAISVLPDSRIARIAAGAPLTGPPCVPIFIPTGALITGSGPEVYAMENGKKRHVTSPAVLSACGYKWGNVDVVADSVLALVPNGPALSGPPCP
jgi:hypothetical protein